MTRRRLVHHPTPAYPPPDIRLSWATAQQQPVYSETIETRDGTLVLREHADGTWTAAIEEVAR